MEIIDVVMRLNGPIEPQGDSSIDDKRLDNLKELCGLTGQLLQRIESVADATDGHMASIKAAKAVAAEFLTACGIERMEPLGGEQRSANGVGGPDRG